MLISKISNIFHKGVDAFKAMPERTLLLLLAVVVGLGSGTAAVILKTLIELIHHALLSWFKSPLYSWFYLIYPGIGMLLSYLIVRYIVKDNIGHGVTKVLLAISRKESNIKSHNMWSSVAASSMTIGFGGSVGAEAPIVYTGAAVGSNVAKVLGLSYKNMTILLACGAAGAVAGIFKAPMAGVLFTMEILLLNISMTSILPLLLSSVSATLVSYLLLGDTVAFANSVDAFRLGNLPYYIILGIFCGFVSLYFTRMTLMVEDRMRKFVNPYVKWLFCAISLGILIFIFPPLFGEGYDSLSPMLHGEPIATAGSIFGFVTGKWGILVFFLFVMLFKVFATAFTNAGGGVGGTFGPTLFTGAMAGFVLSRFINNLGITELPEANFVLVGMAGLMAGVMQAPMTAIFLIAEITGGYVLLYPLIITSAVSFATIRSVEKYSIYTKRLAAQGDLLTHDSDQAVLTLLKVSDLIETDFECLGVNHNLGDMVKYISKSERNIFPVVDDDDNFEGVVFLSDVRAYMFNQDLYNKIMMYSVMKEPAAMIDIDEKMDSVMRKFEESGAWNLPVIDSSGKYKGFVSKSRIFTSYREQLQQVSHD
jgi:CIC family chloride channel protein